MDSQATAPRKTQLLGAAIAQAAWLLLLAWMAWLACRG